MSKDGLNGTGGSVSNAEIKIYVDGNECNYYQFGTYDYGNESEAIVFTIKNTGASTLNLTDSFHITDKWILSITFMYSFRISIKFIRQL